MLAQILNTITALRAAYTDARAANLDATISSRAPSSTALNNTVWTSTKAGYLDATISGRASAAALATVDANVDAIKADTDAYLDAPVSSAIWQPCTGLPAPVGSAQWRLDQVDLSSTSLSVAGSSGVWYPILTVSGRGLLTWLACYASGTTAGTWYSRLKVNGSIIATSGSLTPTSSGHGWVMVGGGVFDSADPYVHALVNGYCPFTTSWSVEVMRSGSSGAEDFVAKYAYGSF